MASLLFQVDVLTDETQLKITDKTNSSTSRVGGWATAPSAVTINEFSISRYDGSSFVSIKDLNTNVGVTGNFPSDSGTASHTFSLSDLDVTTDVLADGVYLLDVNITATESGVSTTYRFTVGFVAQQDLRCKIKSLLLDLANDCIDCNGNTKDEIFCQIQSAKSYLEGAYASASLINASVNHYACAGELFDKAVAAAVTSKNCCD
tara:strand:- start:1043 stop:1657 length:615 start_codon:yes stop_codon:yes gene_type:complete